MSDSRLADIETFRASFAGTLWTPGQPGYDTGRAIWNGSIDRRPALIASCGTAQQVADAVALLVTNDYITGETLVIDGGLTSRIA